LVAAVHAAFLPEIPELQKLVLKGDYSKLVPMDDAQKAGLGAQVEGRREARGSEYFVEDGLELHLGARLYPEQLRLVFTARTDTSPPTAEVLIHHTHPRYGMDAPTFGKFAGHTDPSVLLEAFFEALTKYLADEPSSPS
jgi:hypothetical protein